MTVVLVIIHGLLGVGLLGAITHQVVSFWRVQPAPAGLVSFVTRLRNVGPAYYTNVTVLLYVVNFVLGCIIYPQYRLDVRPALEDARMLIPAGAFETKEHLAVLGLGILPAYWLFWKDAILSGHLAARKYVTLLLAFFVWWSFIVGHVLNNIFGLL